MNTPLWILVLIVWAIVGHLFWTFAVLPMKTPFETTWKHLIVLIVSYIVLAGPVGVACLIIYTICRIMLKYGARQ